MRSAGAAQLDVQGYVGMVQPGDFTVSGDTPQAYAVTVEVRDIDLSVNGSAVHDINLATDVFKAGGVEIYPSAG